MVHDCGVKNRQNSRNKKQAQIFLLYNDRLSIFKKKVLIARLYADIL